MPQGDDRVPDFAAVYGLSSSADSVPPRLAFALWVAAGVLADTYRDPRTWPQLLEHLPPIAGRLADSAWTASFVACFDALRERLGRGGYEPHELARCTGEEMALHLIVAAAEDLADSGGEVQMAAPQGLGRDDPDYELARSILFQDEDVLMLFEAALDGIEDPDIADIGLDLVNLHPRDWFVLFDDAPD